MQINLHPSSVSTVRHAGPGPARAARVDAARPVDDATTGDAGEFSQKALARQVRQVPAPPHAMPAAVLYAMFDQMGGAATSVWKGMHVNLVV